MVCRWQRYWMDFFGRVSNGCHPVHKDSWNTTELTSNILSIDAKLRTNSFKKQLFEKCLLASRENRSNSNRLADLGKHVHLRWLAPLKHSPVITKCQFEIKELTTELQSNKFTKSAFRGYVYIITQTATLRQFFGSFRLHQIIHFLYLNREFVDLLIKKPKRSLNSNFLLFWRNWRFQLIRISTMTNQKKERALLHPHTKRLCRRRIFVRFLCSIPF